MKQLIRLRDEPLLDDATVIIRAGAKGLADESLLRTTKRSHDEYGWFAVSVYAVPAGGVAALATGRDHLARYGSIARSSAGRLRAAGFPLLPTHRDPQHDDVILADQRAPTLDRLRGCFGAAEANPAK
jgi:hypothetical protein